MNKRCTILDDLIKQNPNAHIIEIPKKQLKESRRYLNIACGGLFEYAGLYFSVKKVSK